MFFRPQKYLCSCQGDDVQMRQEVEEHKIMTKDDMRYMDDGRALMYPLRAEWRWVKEGLLFCGKEEDSLMTDTE